MGGALEALRNPDPEQPLDLTASPTWKSDYSAALMNGEALGPRDFADHYALGALQAAHEIHGFDDSNQDVVDARFQSAALGADQLAAQLPGRRDWTDAALSLAPDPLSPEHVQVRQSLLQHWQDTDQHPLDAAVKAQTDPVLRDKLLTPPPEPEHAHSIVNDFLATTAQTLWQPFEDTALKFPSPSHAWEAAVAGAQKAWNNGELFEYDKAIQKLHEDHPGPLTLALSQLAGASDLGLHAAGMALFGLGAAGYSLLDEALARHPDNPEEAARTAVSMAYSFPMGLKGTIGLHVPKFAPDPPAKMIDLAKEPGEAVSDVPAMEAFIPPHSGLAVSDVLPIGDRIQNPIIAFHGTPHDFVLFSKDHIGGGEGAQIYGRGLYFAEHPEVASQYKDAGGLRFTNGEVYDEANPQHLAALELHFANGDRLAAKVAIQKLINDRSAPQDMSENYAHALDALNKREPLPELVGGGNLYKVALHVDKNALLDWDKPLEEQSETVQTAVKQLLQKDGDGTDLFPIGMTGQSFHQYMVNLWGPTLASHELHDAGILGTKYLDGFSRQEGEGTHNYVIFYDNAIQMLEKNGKPVKFSPAQNMQALVQEHQYAGKEVSDDPKFFENLAVDQDPKTQELGRGYDTARHVLNFFTQTIPQALRDIQGAVTRPPPAWGGRAPVPEELPRGERVSRLAMMDNAESLIRKFPIGRAGAQSKYVGSVLDELRPLVNPHMKEWDEALDSYEAYKKQGGNVPYGGVEPWNTTIGQLIGHMQGVPGFALAPDHPLTPVANVLRDLNLWSHNWLDHAASLGIIDVPSYIQNYYRQMWKDPNQADIWAGGRQGSSAGLMHRTVPDWFEGLRGGLIPKERNPLNLTLQDISAKFRHIAAQEVIKEARDRGWAKYGSEAPNFGDVRLNGLGAQRRMNYMVDVKDENGNVIGQQPGGHDEYLYAHPGFARIYNNWVSTHDMPVELNRAANVLANLKNGVVGYQLSLPLYHLAVVIQEAMGGGYGNALQELARGEFGRGAADILKSTLFPWKATELYLKGRAGYDRYLEFGGMTPTQISQDPLIKSVVDAGIYMGPRQQIYRAGTAPNIIKSLMEKDLGNQLRADWNKIVGPNGNGILAVPGVTMHEMGRLISSIGAPLFDDVIPYIKAGTNLERARTFLRQNRTADEFVASRRIRQIIKNTDDRLGEMNQEALFWPRWAKHVANATMISTGWVYGTVRYTAAAFGVKLAGTGTRGGVEPGSDNKSDRVVHGLGRSQFGL